VPTQPRHTFWKCICACGNEAVVRSDQLRGGIVQSCGCRIREAIVKHALHRTQLYGVWKGCSIAVTTPRSRAWRLYGGRGITVCDKWRRDVKAFAEYVGERPGPGYSIDRIDVNGNYEPGNVRWATPNQQIDNRRPLPASTRRNVRSDNTSGITGVFYALQGLIGRDRHPSTRAGP
jgi:hypothetical protein